ncbi:MAG: putative transporter [Verrucomicrobiales bacterium]|nr:putative transporter [Verrucomicrobiales bacterium]
MSWLANLQEAQPVAHAMIILCGVAVVGLALGNLRVRGLSFGVAGTLFAGLVFGHFGLNIAPAVRTFIQEFGLILFVYTIGMQVGPGFIDSLKRQGLPLNLAAASIVILGALLAVGLSLLFRIDPAVAAGIFSGATTNTPSLGAAQEALRSLPGATPERTALPGMGYAVAYPFGILGIIISMLAIRALGRINVAHELHSFREAQRAGQESLTHLTVMLTNPNLDGLEVRQLPGIEKLGVVISRLRKSGQTEVHIARAETVLGVGDTLVVVGTAKATDQFRMIVGRVADDDLTQATGNITYQRVVMTNRQNVGKSLRELALNHRYGVTVTRLTRADLELTVTPDLPLQFGDMLRIVGTEESIARASELLGNSVRELSHARLVPIFVGITLGVLLGCYPLSLGNMPAPLRLGLAGGPLLVAIILSRIGRIGPLLWYLPANANVLLREFGIVLFLSCVGLKSGTHFVEALLQGGGFLWMGVGVVVTLVPLLLVGWVMRRHFQQNYMNVCGLLAGSMTDPPALAFANNISGSDAPSVAYATVYPLTMILRILLGQLIILIFCR